MGRKQIAATFFYALILRISTVKGYAIIKLPFQLIIPIQSLWNHAHRPRLFCEKHRDKVIPKMISVHRTPVSQWFLQNLQARQGNQLKSSAVLNLIYIWKPVVNCKTVWATALPKPSRTFWKCSENPRTHAEPFVITQNPWSRSKHKNEKNIKHIHVFFKDEAISRMEPLGNQWKSNAKIWDLLTTVEIEWDLAKKPESLNPLTNTSCRNILMPSIASMACNALSNIHVIQFLVILIFSMAPDARNAFRMPSMLCNAEICNLYEHVRGDFCTVR